MSSFKENFGRSSDDQNLQYDDTAFYYFAVSMLSSLAILFLFFIIRRIMLSDANFKSRINPLDQSLHIKLKHLNRTNSNQKYNLTFKIFVLLFVISIYLAYTTSQLITKKDDMKRFDPYEILEISRSASVSEIRKAYRRLMIMYHPDKNPSSEASAKFILVTKANECLTDETKRLTCEQFGSPDGPGSLQVAIAMPSFFQKKENHVMILACFSIFFVIFLPAAVLIWLNRSQKHNSHGMSMENYKIALMQLSQNIAPSKLIEIIGFCDEFKFQVSKSELDYFKRDSYYFKICQSTQFLEETYPSTKGVPATKAQKLLILRFENIPIPKESEEQMQIILQKTPMIIDSMIDQCLQINAVYPKTDRKYLSIQTLHNVIYFQQRFFQGLWSTKSDLDFEQISVVYSGDISSKKLVMRYKNLKTLMGTPRDERKYEFGNSNLKEEEKQQLTKLMNDEVDSFPLIQVNVDVCFDEEGQDKITASASNKNISINIEAGQIISINVYITYLNYPEDGFGNFALTHRYPYFKNICQHIYLTEKDSIFEYTLLTGQKNKLEFKSKKALSVGEFNFEVFVSPDCYIGLNQTFKINAKVIQPKEKIIDDSDIHPYDIEKASEPNFMEKLILSQQQGREEEEEEEEEPEQEEINKNEDQQNDDQEQNSSDHQKNL